jgi:hypothetical protein
MRRPSFNAEPALTRSDLIPEVAASNPHLRAADAQLIVATIFDQITPRIMLVIGDRLSRSVCNSGTAPPD